MTLAETVANLIEENELNNLSAEDAEYAVRAMHEGMIRGEVESLLFLMNRDSEERPY